MPSMSRLATLIMLLIASFEEGCEGKEICACWNSRFPSEQWCDDGEIINVSKLMYVYNGRNYCEDGECPSFIGWCNFHITDTTENDYISSFKECNGKTKCQFKATGWKYCNVWKWYYTNYVRIDYECISTSTPSREQKTPDTTSSSTSQFPDVNECASNPCLNGGTCADLINYYTCSCAAGYTGTNCETDVNECASNPCLNGGRCADFNDHYTCSCPAGYRDTNCETDVNECASNPCLNGGTCADLIDHYTCSCAAGYTGTKCETDVPTAAAAAAAAAAAVVAAAVGLIVIVIVTLIVCRRRRRCSSTECDVQLAVFESHNGEILQSTTRHNTSTPSDDDKSHKLTDTQQTVEYSTLECVIAPAAAARQPTADSTSDAGCANCNVDYH